IHGERDFARRIAEAVAGLDTFRAQEADRIGRLRGTFLADDRADALILRGYEAGIVGARELPRVIRQWRNPTPEELRPRPSWSLLNACTAALKRHAKSQPHSFAARTMRLNALLDPEPN